VLVQDVPKGSDNGAHDVVFLYFATFVRLGVVSVLGFDSGLTMNAGAGSLKPTRGLLSDIVKHVIYSLPIFKPTHLTAH